jgi:hypothetical protein
MPILLSVIWSGCFVSGRTAITPRRAAQAFADHLNSVLNRTVTDSRLSLIPLPYSTSAFELTRLVGEASAPLELDGTAARLFVRQIIEVIDGHCRTESYSYRLQADEAVGSWLVRWEYHRERPRHDYSYPLAHVHVNATFDDGIPAGRLHIPTRRVPLELVIWHLIAEWDVRPRLDEWQPLLGESIEGFDERRRAD